MDTGGCLTVQQSIVNGTELGAQECRYALFLRYGLYPPDLTKLCDGFNATFSIFHALDLKNGGLVTACHNKICGGVADLSIKSFTPTHVRDNPLIYAVHVAQNPKARLEE